MSDSENYFSDTDKSEGDNIEPNNDDFLDEQEYEMDEESRRIIYEACLRKKDSDSIITEEQHKPSKKKKERKIKEKNTMNLFDFDKKFDENKSKKWSGKRFSDRKKKLGIDEVKVVTRQFNPRLPIPNQHTFRRVDIIDDFQISEEDYPELELEV